MGLDLVLKRLRIGYDDFHINLYKPYFHYRHFGAKMSREKQITPRKIGG